MVEIGKDLGLPVTDADSDFFEGGGYFADRDEADRQGGGDIRRGRPSAHDLYAESSLRDIAASIRRNGSLAGAVGRS